MIASYLLWSTLVLAADLPKEHLPANTVYRELIEEGVPVRDRVRVKPPSPTLADGLDAAAQRTAFSTFVDTKKHDVEVLLEARMNSPFELKIRDINDMDPPLPIKGVDFWFFLRGDLETISRKEFLQQLLRMTSGAYTRRDLSEKELAKRKIQLTQWAGVLEEYYSQRVFTLFNKAEISETNHVMVTRTADSLLVATMLDPRFLGDPEFPCQWRRVTPRNGEDPELGPPNPYRGVGYYIKVTRLVEPAGTLLVEFHIVLNEPKEMFDGANLIRSKLPMLVQSEVRRLRREMSKAKPAE